MGNTMVEGEEEGRGSGGVREVIMDEVPLLFI